MIIFLFGTWGCGKSYAGRKIEDNCHLQHLEADLFFDEQMRQALIERTFHLLDLSDFTTRVITEMQSYSRRADNFVVSQAIYEEKYRRMIYDAFAPEIRFVWVRTIDEEIQKMRLASRAEEHGNVITPEVYDYMMGFWDPPQLEHDVLVNDETLGVALPVLLHTYGMCMEWGPKKTSPFIEP